jgi:hypothetical protein
LRAATSFFILQVVNSFVALTVLAITWMSGAFGFPVVLANVPGIILMVYLCVVTNSYRMSLKRNAAGGAYRAATTGMQYLWDGPERGGEWENAVTTGAAPVNPGHLCLATPTTLDPLAVFAVFAGAVALPPARPGYREHEEDDEAMGGDVGLDAVAAGGHAAKYRDAVSSFDDELTVTAKDVELGAARPPRAGHGSGVTGRAAAVGAGAGGAAVALRGGSLQSVGGGAAAVPSIAEAEEGSDLDLDDDDNDLGKPSGQRRV